MSILDYPQREPDSIKELHDRLVDLVNQLENSLFAVIRGVTIKATETPVAHGQSSAPKAMLAIPRTNVAVWSSHQPDAKCGYFTAASSVVCDVKIFP